MNYYKIISISRLILARANMGLDFVSGQYGCLFSRCRKYVINSLIHGHFHIGLVIIPRPILALDVVSGQYGNAHVLICNYPTPVLFEQSNYIDYIFLFTITNQNTILFWYLIRVQRQQETATTAKYIRITLFSALYWQFGSCCVLFDIAG